MSRARDAGRVAGLWYLLLVLLGPVRLIYVQNKLIDADDAARTASNLLAHARLFRWGMVSELAAALVLIFLVLTFYQLFEGVDRYLAVLVVVLGGVMPALLNFVNVVTDAGALLVLQAGGFLSGFDAAQRNGLALLLLRLHGRQDAAAELLWGAWLFPLALLVYRSGFLPRWLGWWLGANGVAYVMLCLGGMLGFPYQARMFLWAQPALFGEIALMLWLVIRGARPREEHAGVGRAA